jgi:hypothetical protein
MNPKVKMSDEPFIAGASVHCGHGAIAGPPNGANNRIRAGRRRFLQSGLAAAGAMVAEPLLRTTALADLAPLEMPGTGPDSVPRTPLGKTGEQVSIIGLGGYHLGTTESLKSVIRLVHEWIRWKCSARTWRSPGVSSHSALRKCRRCVIVARRLRRMDISNYTNPQRNTTRPSGVSSMAILRWRSFRFDFQGPANGFLSFKLSPRPL